MPGLAQQLDKGGIDALIEQPMHAGSAVDQGLVGQVVRREGLRRADVV